MHLTPVYVKTITIPASIIDENGHVNNVTYVQWMQDIAVEHYASLGGIEAHGDDATWVVREHKIEYLLPAFANEEIEIRTWIENVRRVRSLRKYEFVRKSDGKVLVNGETDWVFVDASTGSPRAIPEEVMRVFANASQPNNPSHLHLAQVQVLRAERPRSVPLASNPLHGQEIASLRLRSGQASGRTPSSQ